ncbi:hypothetical protein [Paracidobacterium acidisoli]|uniref:Uncharacterized protein n=1 Tax=Paracidobacterium acidisoli TaxID=2303751 RepID=A0A372ILL5_9BACT|nr:hypothetical protein [Paracidobacterium acidisoli]MBT9332449.1 hypothetical protein [Paracidobacterium acidisoli]
MQPNSSKLQGTLEIAKRKRRQYPSRQDEPRLPQSPEGEIAFPAEFTPLPAKLWKMHAERAMLWRKHVVCRKTCTIFRGTADVRYFPKVFNEGYSLNPGWLRFQAGNISVDSP